MANPRVVDASAPYPFAVGVVIPVGPGREANLRKVLDALDHQTHLPEQVILVFDGIEPFDVGAHWFAIRKVRSPKHEPGMEQPRNVGVRQLQAIAPQCEYVWFLDSDVIPCADALQGFRDANDLHAENCVLIGPYEFLPPNLVGMHPEVKSDARWPWFDTYGPERIFRCTLGAALACFSGNLLWPIDKFMAVGGFHPELYHGRCEDGELGLRASSQGVGMSFVARARGYHQWHNFNLSVVEQRNARDVPLLKQWHPWVHKEGLVVSSEDGARFDFKCPRCGAQVNTGVYWTHEAGCSR